MGSPPVPARPLPPVPSTSTAVPPSSSSSRPPGFNGVPPKPAPAYFNEGAPWNAGPREITSVRFVPPKKRFGGSLKGKERAGDGGGGADKDGGDLAFPVQRVVTYRDLLGRHNTGANNPLRVIAHVDIDAAYASMEMARLGVPDDTPLCTQQWNGLIAINYPARKFGITRHMKPAEALQLCPHLKLVHVMTYKEGESEAKYTENIAEIDVRTHKICLDYYRRESAKIFAVFSSFAPIVERASIDEAYFDLTLFVRTALLERYPALSSPPSGDLDAPLPSPDELGVLVDWEQLGNLIPVDGQKPTDAPSPPLSVKEEGLDGLVKEEVGGEVAAQHGDGGLVKNEGEEKVKEEKVKEEGDMKGEEKLDSPDDPPAASSTAPPTSEPLLTWSDVALSIGAALVKDTRTAVREQLGYTCSAGIATNRCLSKLTSGWKKPNNQTILRHCAVPAFLINLPFRKMRNFGGAFGRAVAATYEAELVGDLLHLTRAELKAKLGNETGTWLFEALRGMDWTEVKNSTLVKSMLSCKDTIPNVETYGAACRWLFLIATDLVSRLLENRASSTFEWPKTITLRHRIPHPWTSTSTQMPFPYTDSPTAAYIAEYGERLFRSALNIKVPPSGVVPPQTRVITVSHLSLGLTGLERLEEGQIRINDFLNASTTAGIGPIDLTVSSDEEDEAVDVGHGEEERKPSTSRLDSPSPPAKRRRLVFPSSVCGRCRKTLVLSAEQQESATREGSSREEIRDVLKRVETEHRDWHLAKDLLEKDRAKHGWGLTNTASSTAASSKTSPRKKRKGSESGGTVDNKAQGSLRGFFRSPS